MQGDSIDWDRTIILGDGAGTVNVNESMWRVGLETWWSLGELGGGGCRREVTSSPKVDIAMLT